MSTAIAECSSSATIINGINSDNCFSYETQRQFDQYINDSARKKKTHFDSTKLVEFRNWLLFPESKPTRLKVSKFLLLYTTSLKLIVY